MHIKPSYKCTMGGCVWSNKGKKFEFFAKLGKIKSGYDPTQKQLVCVKTTIMLWKDNNNI